MVLRHAEGSSCPWTSSAFWFRHWTPEHRRRGKCCYRDVSRANAATTWQTISILCKIFFSLSSNQIKYFSGFLWHSLLARSSRIYWRVDRSPDWKESTICTYNIFHTIIYGSGSPFNQILAHASSHAKISDQQAERIKSSGVGLLTTWSPQQFILNHPVLYFYFLSWLDT